MDNPGEVSQILSGITSDGSNIYYFWCGKKLLEVLNIDRRVALNICSFAPTRVYTKKINLCTRSSLSDRTRPAGSVLDRYFSTACLLSMYFLTFPLSQFKIAFRLIFAECWCILSMLKC